ncbi:tetratricopeptide repeat protein [Nocardia sp. NPDC059240]|uniref:tetratricopeptide repeat protein n=1 Tax=Nocardia sp. NPDC059240 TaxID=3346786 RepID=UPI0036B37FD1
MDRVPGAVQQSAVVVGDGNYIVQAGGDVSALPPEALIPVAAVQAPSGLSNHRLTAARFVGRAQHLDCLDEALVGSGPVVVAAVHGLGGIGKTTLVAQWIATRGHRWTPVWWITADSPAAVQQGLADFAAALQPALSSVLSVKHLAERGLQWLVSHDGWLVVLDNVTVAADIEQILARTRSSAGRVIITSRLSTGWQQAELVVGVDVLNASESRALLCGTVTTGGPRELDGASDLCEMLGHLPLAVDQAAAFLAQNSLLTPRDYLTLLVGQPGRMYGQAAVGIAPERTLARIWRVTLDRIAETEPFAVELLAVLAWYAPEAIPAELWDGLADPATCTAAVGVLAAYSMITPDPATRTVSIHRLVQAVTHTADPADPHRTPAKVLSALGRATGTLAQALPGTLDELRLRPAWRPLLPHAEALADYSGPETDTVTTAKVLNSVAVCLLEQGLPGRALSLLQRAVAGNAILRDGDEPATLSARYNLASAYEHAGDLPQAISLFEQTLTDCEGALGGDHACTLLGRNNLASAYYAAGDLGRAIPLYERTCADRQRVFGSDDPATLDSRNNLTRAYTAAGYLSRATLAGVRALADCERVLGSDHPSTSVARANLAHAYVETQELGRAIPLYLRSLADVERVLGEDHPQTLALRNNVATAYRMAGDFGRAIVLYERSLADTERVLGGDHPDTLTSRSNLAGVYRAAGELGRALPLYEHMLADSERLLGDDHPGTLTARNNLACAYDEAGDQGRAIPLHERTVADRERVLGPAHPSTLTSRNNLIYAYWMAGDVSRVIPLCRRLLADCERVLGPDHRLTAMVRDNLDEVTGQGACS